MLLLHIMKFIRSLHLYLGCIFAPLLMLYALSGAWQVYRLNDAAKDGSYTPPAWLKTVSAVHLHQALEKGTKAAASKVLAVVLGVALAAMTVSGVVMAYKFGRNKALVTLCLLLGIVLPGVLLYLKI